VETDSELILLLKEILSELRHHSKLMTKTEPIFISKSKTAHMLDVSTATIDRLAREGIIMAYNIKGRKMYNRKEVLQAIGDMNS